MRLLVHESGYEHHPVHKRDQSFVVAAVQHTPVMEQLLGYFILRMVGLLEIRLGDSGARGRVLFLLVHMVVLEFLILHLIRWLTTLQYMGRVGAHQDPVATEELAHFLERDRPKCIGGSNWIAPPATKPGQVDVSKPPLGSVASLPLVPIRPMMQPAKSTVSIVETNGRLLTN